MRIATYSHSHRSLLDGSSTYWVVRGSEVAASVTVVDDTPVVTPVTSAIRTASMARTFMFVEVVWWGAG